MKHRILAYKES